MILSLFLVSFSVSAESVFGDMEGEYMISDPGGQETDYMILMLNEGDKVTLNFHSHFGDVLIACEGNGEMVDEVMETELNCIIEDAFQFPMSYNVDMTGITDTDDFVAPMVMRMNIHGGETESTGKGKFARI